MMQRDSARSVRYGAFNRDGTFFATPTRIPVDMNPQEAPASILAWVALRWLKFPTRGANFVWI